MLSYQAIRVIKSHTRKKECYTGEEQRQYAFPELSCPELNICLWQKGHSPKKKHKPYQYLGDNACHIIHIPSKGQPLHNGFVLQFSFASLTNKAWYSLKRLMSSLSLQWNRP